MCYGVIVKRRKYGYNGEYCMNGLIKRTYRVLKAFAMNPQRPVILEDILRRDISVYRIGSTYIDYYGEYGNIRPREALLTRKLLEGKYIELVGEKEFRP